MTLEGKDYLFNISQRVEDYDNIRAKVTDYCIDNSIDNYKLTTQLLCMGFLHQALQRGENLTMSDIDTMLGVSEHDEYGVETLELDEDLHHLTLNELLDCTVEDWSIGE